ISLRGVTKSFGSHTVLSDISFDVPKGRITAILGPSGTRKSVLLKNIIGLLRPDKGEIWVDGEQTVGMREKDLYRIRRKFGVLFDEPDSGLDPVRVAYLDELVIDVQHKTGATFFIITHNIPSVMRTAEFMGVLFRSGLVKFASKQEMLDTDNPIIRQFLAGKAKGPIGMDEMASEDDEEMSELDESDDYE